MTAGEEKKKEKKAVAKVVLGEGTGCANPKSLGLPRSQERPWTQAAHTET